ncbi:MAG: DUF255 domain-containing protein, partial [Chitinophagaceae bacterium]
MKQHCTTKTILILLFCFFFQRGFSQVEFFSGSLKEALDKATGENKFLLLQIEATDCEQCNDVANKGFENKELAAKLETSFVCLKIDGSHPSRSQIFQTYHLQPQTFGTLFLDNNGTLLHSFLKTTTFSKELMSQIDIAFSKAGEVLQISLLENEYKNGNRGYGFIEMLLEKRSALHLSTDSLLEQYIEVLPSDSLKSIRTLVFIAQMAPMLGSKADRALRGDRNLFNQAWYSMNLAKRVQINNVIIYKGME